MNESTDYQKLILDFITRPNYQPLKLRVIAKKLDLLDEEKQLKRALKQLIKQKRVAFGSKHLVQAIPHKTSGTDTTATPISGKTSERSNEIICTFRKNTAGFGFATPKASKVTDRSEDIFIPKQKTLDAADLDVVRVRLSRSERGRRGNENGPPKRSGRIVEVLERNTSRFVGTYTEHDGTGIVIVDGGVFDTGIFVGDASARNCRVDDKVVIDLVRFPSNFQDGEGVIVEVLGERGKSGVDTLSIIHQYGLPQEFPTGAMESAREQAGLFDDSQVPPSRTDFTQKTVVTIDPATARDFDDAISLERMENGHWLLGVHIADVSHFVQARSALDDEAYNRATSIYLPDRVIPMLPEIISNNLASLQPNRLRYCMTAMMELDEKGIPIHTEMHRGVIKSAHRFTYEDIDEYLKDDQPWQEKLTPPVFELVRNMHTLAMKMRKRRMDKGAINLVLPEVKIDLDENGKVCGAHTEDNTESHQVIEEFMLAANIAVAQWLADRKHHVLRRIHPNPGESKMEELTAFVKGLGLEVSNLQDRFELKRIVEQSEETPEQHAIHYAVLRSMAKAVYSPEDVGHYALNANIYCHFTSPIRRYPDLVIHRMVGDVLEGKKPNDSFERMVSVGSHCSQLEKRAAEAERELVKLKLLNFMSDKVGTKMHARITGVEAFGIFAQGEEIPAEGLIPIANLPEDSYQYDRGARLLSGFKRYNQFKLGDLIEVKVSLVNPDRRILEFTLIGANVGTANPRPNVVRRAATPLTPASFAKSKDRPDSSEDASDESFDATFDTSEKPDRGDDPHPGRKRGIQKSERQPSRDNERRPFKRTEGRPGRQRERLSGERSVNRSGEQRSGEQRPTRQRPTGQRSGEQRTDEPRSGRQRSGDPGSTEQRPSRGGSRSAGQSGARSEKRSDRQPGDRSERRLTATGTRSSKRRPSSNPSNKRETPSEFDSKTTGKKTYRPKTESGPGKKTGNSPRPSSPSESGPRSRKKSPRKKR